MNALDATIPTGNPESVTCRWCGGPRTLISGARFCIHCDKEGHQLAARNAGLA